MHESLATNTENSCRQLLSKGDSLNSISEYAQMADIVSVTKLSGIIKSLQQKIKKIEAHNAMIVKENIEYVQSIEEHERENNLKLKKIEAKMELLKEKLNRMKKKNKIYKQRLEQKTKKLNLKGLGINMFKTNQRLNVINDELENNQKDYSHQSKKIECKLKKISSSVKSFHTQPRNQVLRKKNNRSNLTNVSKKHLTKSMQV